MLFNQAIKHNEVDEISKQQKSTYLQLVCHQKNEKID